MTNWLYRVQIKDLLAVDDESDETVKRVSGAIAKRLRESVWATNCRTVLDYVNTFEELEGSTSSGLLEEFSCVLDCLYDLADDTGCWVS